MKPSHRWRAAGSVFETRVALTVAACIVSACLPSIARGQSFNVDMATGSSTSPMAGYGGAEDQRGEWNHVSHTGNTFLADLNGNATSVFIQHGMTVSSGGDIAGADPDDNALMKSYWYALANRPGLTVRGLAAGDYRLYLYGWGGVSGGTGHTVFQVSLSEKTNYEIRWDAVWTGQQQGQTYAIANVSVLPSQIVFINFQFDGGENPPPMLINGLQIVTVPAQVALGASMWGALFFGIRRQRE